MKRRLDILSRKCASIQKCCYIGGFIGLLLALFGTWAYMSVDSFIARAIEKQIPINPHNPDTYKKWERLAVPLTMRFWLFNVTNAAGILNRGEMPDLVQVGPYVFTETRFKTGIRFERSYRHVVFKENKLYWFNRQRSVGSLDDIVIMPSLPEIAMAAKLSDQATQVPAISNFLYTLLNAAIRTTNTKLFAPHRVGDMLFDGYTVRALETLLNISSNIPNNPLNIKNPLPNNRFGFMYLKNGTEDPDSLEWRIHTGLGDASRFGQVISYNEHQENTCWRKSYYCNAMIGTDGSSFPPNLDEGYDHPSGQPASESMEHLSLYKPSALTDEQEQAGPQPNARAFGRIIGDAENEKAYILNFEHSSADASGKRRLYVYNPDIYRWVYLQYEKPSIVRGIQAYRYTLPKLFYTAPSDAPENACFCTKHPEYDLNKANRRFLESLEGRNMTASNIQKAYRQTFPAQCRLNGILDISHCRKAPIIISAPHFYMGDSILAHSLRGIHPDEALHKTYVDIEPRTGIVIGAARRAQINVELTANPRVEMLSDLGRVIETVKKAVSGYHSSVGEYNGLILPVLWLEETAQVDEKNANLLKSKLISKITLLNVLTLFIASLGIILMTITFVYLVFVNFILNQHATRVATTDPDADSGLPEKKPIK